MYLNKVQLYGNLTRDPEVKSLPSGSTVANFSIATNRVYKDKDGAKQEQTEFHNVVAFAKQADLIGQYMRKGKAIFVEGRLQTRSWEKDGAKQYRTEVVCEQFQFGPSAPGNSRAEREDRGEDTDEPRKGATEAAAESGEAPEDIPF